MSAEETRAADTEFRTQFERAVRSIIRAELRPSPSEAAQLSVQVFGGLAGPGGGSRVDALGKLLDRLPDALSVAEICLVLDRFDVALRGHAASPSIGAPGPESRDASEAIVGDASGVVLPQSTPDAPSRVVNGAALRAIRHALGVSNGDLAARAGITPGTLTHIEKDGRQVSAATQRALASALVVPLEAITYPAAVAS